MDSEAPQAMETEASPSENAPAAVTEAAPAAAAGSPRSDAMEVDADQKDAMDADQKDVLCTVCALTLPPCLPCLPHPRLEGKIDVACCGVCADELEQADEDDEDDDACAWCDDGGELLVCEGCERAFCRNCLQRHCGASYVDQALQADVWDGPCCRPPPAIESLVAAAAPRLADESDEVLAAARDERIEALLKPGRIARDFPGQADEGFVLMHETSLKNAITTQPQVRNTAGRVFGGALMRYALELAFATAYAFSGCRSGVLHGRIRSGAFDPRRCDAASMAWTSIVVQNIFACAWSRTTD